MCRQINIFLTPKQYTGGNGDANAKGGTELLFIVPPAVKNRHNRTQTGSQNCRAYDSCRIHTAILTPVSDHIDRDQLQRRNI